MNIQKKIQAQRLFIGSMTLVLILIWGLWAQAAQAQTMQVDSALIITVSNEAEDEMVIRLEDSLGRVLVHQLLQPQQNVSFRIDAQDCRQALRAFVNGRFLRRLRNHLCPEAYPDEQKGIAFLHVDEVVVLGEDRD